VKEERGGGREGGREGREGERGRGRREEEEGGGGRREEVRGGGRGGYMVDDAHHDDADLNHSTVIYSPSPICRPVYIPGPKRDMPPYGLPSSSH
jgi:hypothetical protein